MGTKPGFDNEKYLKEQTKAILKRVKQFDNKLYLEFGGKLLFDYHASRVLPGFDPNVKMKLLKKLKDKSDIILCIYAGDIERKKIRADFGITYDMDAFKLIDDLMDWDIDIRAVVITRYQNQPAANIFMNKLKRQGIKVYTHAFTKGYPTDADLIVSDEGYGANDYIETKNDLVIVTAPGPGSGKLATCLSQLYHEHKRGIKGGYAKFETFPIWNLPLKHPVNIAYEAATVDIKDYNMIDSFHLEKHKETAVNYNRDMEIFPVLKRILRKIMGKTLYHSPTDMGVNCAGSGIVNDKIVREAAHQEIIRRYFRCKYEYVMGLVDQEAVQRSELLMEEVGVKAHDRVVVIPAREAAKKAMDMRLGNKGIFCGAALQLHNGDMITGKNSPLMHASSSLILNVLKQIAEIPDKIPLLSDNIIEFISTFKRDILNSKTVSLNLDETLISLSISAATNPAAKLALEKIKELKGCEVHMTHIPTSGDEAGLRGLGINLTTDPNLSSRSFYENA
ncbi:MAG: DUF1846 domain-containing protein [Candidatus Omnitrophica bacterium]|nr:DUF1846 domain-containing protein [Candidatus Omnitrophota bacterium]